MRDTERIFHDIAQQVSREAGDVDCSLSEYRDGLLAIIAVLQTDLDAARPKKDDDE